MMPKKYNLLLVLGCTLMYLVIHLLLMPHYGLSWDFHNHYYAGLFHLGLPVPGITDPAPVPFSPPDPRLTIDEPFGPFTQMVPALSHVLFYDRWHVLAYDTAYNLPMVIIGSLGVGLIFIVAGSWFGNGVAWLAFLFLALLPVHFGYLHTNMKDVPDAFFFTLSVYLFWRLTVYRRYRDLLLASVVFAIAFNIKVNAVVVPVVSGCFFVWQWLVKRTFSWRVAGYFLLAPLCALALWWPFWQHPWEKLLEFPEFYSHNTLNMPVLINGIFYRSGVDIPWYYPYLYLEITTPPLILICALIGLFLCLQGIFRKQDKMMMLFLWFFLPLVRLSLPAASAIDGVRHFMEVVYPWCLFAALGAAWLLSFLPRWRYRLVAGILVSLPLLWNIFSYHPYETSYFNALVGGIAGAQGKYDIDFWGTPQREAVRWVNDHAPSGSTVHIVMGQSSAAVYLRPDLLATANQQSMTDSDYTVLMNRESFFPMYTAGPYLDQAIKQQQIVFSIRRGGVPLVWVIKNH